MTMNSEDRKNEESPTDCTHTGITPNKVEVADMQKIINKKKATAKQMDKRKAKGKPLMVWGIPEDIRNDFKTMCKAEGKSMQEVLECLMGEYITNQFG